MFCYVMDCDFFFFKQKTAYEMRISDWSSDVCSSDLFLPGGDELSIRFHHVAVRVEGAMDNWDKYAASIDTDRHPIVFEGQMGDDLRFFYTDERAMLGHYIEHMWMSPAMLDQLETAVPRSPTQGCFALSIGRKIGREHV